MYIHVDAYAHTLCDSLSPPNLACTRLQQPNEDEDQITLVMNLLSRMRVHIYIHDFYIV